MIDLFFTLKDRIQGKAPKGAKRSSMWRRVRREHLKNESCCQVCGKKHSLEVHHIKPFHEYPELELKDSNLVTLCTRCHLFVGHLGYWKTANPECLEDVAHWSFRFSNRGS